MAYTKCDEIQRESSIILSKMNNVDWKKEINKEKEKDNPDIEKAHVKSVRERKGTSHEK